MGGLTNSAAIEQCVLQDDPGLTYYRYAPRRIGPRAPIFVSVHGRSRNAHVHAELFAPFADRAGAVLVAPLFTVERFPDYHCLGRQGRGERSDRVLDAILAETATDAGARVDRIYLFGYSGGGQFAHRYMMAYPERIAAVALGAPGWYTFPDDTLEFPSGIGSTADLPGVTFEPRRFLTVPCLVLAGAGDVLRDPNLNQDPDVDAQQGPHRVARAQRWVAAMRAAAQAHTFSTECRFQVLPGVGHSFADCMTMAGMGEFVFDHLFGHHPVQV